MTLELTLRSEANGTGALEGESLITPLDGAQRSSIAPAFAGRMKVVGTYNSLAKAFVINPTAWMEHSGTSAKTLPLIGVLDGATMTLAGLAVGASPGDSSPYFVLVRDTESAKFLRQVQNSTQAGSVSLGGAPSKKKLLQWASRLRSEYPGFDPQHTVQEQVYWKARNLFDDAHFKTCFGETYDEMSQGSRQAVASMFQGRTQTGPLNSFLRRQQGPVDALRRSADDAKEKSTSVLAQSYGALDRAFMVSGTFAAPDITVSVFAQRALRRWLAGAISDVNRQSPSPDAFRKLDAVEAAAGGTITTLWPSEQTRLREAISLTRARLADATLPLLVQQVTTKANGSSGLTDLANFERNEARLLEYASPASRSRALEQIYKKLDALIEILIAEDLKSLEAIGTSSQAVVAGAQWLTGVWVKYGDARHRPGVVRAVAKLQARRAADLAAEKDSILASITSQQTPEGVRAVLNVALAVPKDAETPAGKLIADQAHRQLQEIGTPGDWLSKLVIVGVGLLLFDAVTSPNDSHPSNPESSQSGYSNNADPAIIANMMADESDRQNEQRRQDDILRRQRDSAAQQARRQQEEYMRQQQERMNRR